MAVVYVVKRIKFPLALLPRTKNKKRSGVFMGYIITLRYENRFDSYHLLTRDDAHLASALPIKFLPSCFKEIINLCLGV